MTEGDWNLVLKVIECKLMKAGLGGPMAEVSHTWLASVLVESERLRQQITEVQAANTALHLKAEAARGSVNTLTAEVETLREDLGRTERALGTVRTERDEAKRERDEAVHERCCARRDLDAAMAVLNGAPFDSVEAVARRVVKERDDARAERNRARADCDVAIADRYQMRQERNEAQERARVSAEETESLGAVVDLARARADELERSIRAVRSIAGAQPNQGADKAVQCVVDALRDERNEHGATKVALVNVAKERDEARTSSAASICELMQQRDEARVELAATVKALDSERARRKDVELAGVPAELARLYKAAQGARNRWGDDQYAKLAEECGEYVTEMARAGERRDERKIFVEAHDVLTVALSLCEPALMLASAERLEGRLST